MNTSSLRDVFSRFRGSWVAEVVEQSGAILGLSWRLQLLSLLGRDLNQVNHRNLFHAYCQTNETCRRTR
jgi:hypothetical protein